MELQTSRIANMGPKKKSNKLLKEECQGDFCEFISMDSMKLAELTSGHKVAKYLKNDYEEPGSNPFNPYNPLIKRRKITLRDHLSPSKTL